MGLEEIRQRIISEAKKESEGILAKSMEEAKEIIEKAEMEAERIRLSYEAKAGAEAERIRNRILSSAKMDARMRILEEKRKGIESVFSMVMKELKNAGDEEKEGVIRKCTEVIPDGEYEFDCAESDMKFFNKRLKEISKRNKRTVIRPGKAVDIIGGFILRSKDMDYDFSFDSIIREKRREMEKDIVRFLFGD